MKQIVSIAACLLALTLSAAPRSLSAEAIVQANTHSSSGRATSHDRHTRKHHTSNRHHRHRTTAKSHNS